MAKLTVLMPVYNGEHYLRESIESILNQNYPDFEFLIIDDGSTDGSVDIIQSYSDPRIRLVRNDGNRGLIYTLNRGLDLASGEYIARMDCDDYAYPHRLRTQVELLDQRPEIGLCGTSMRYMDREVWVRHPEHHEEIKARLLFQCTLNHPTVMLRSSVLKDYGLYYSESAPHAEDYELWVRLSNVTRIANLPDDLLLYRIHPGQVGALYSEQQKETGKAVMLQQLQNMGLEPTPEELELHWSLSTHAFTPSQNYVEAVRSWVLRLQDANARSGYLDAGVLSQVLGEYCVMAESTWRQVWQAPAGRRMKRNTTKSKKARSRQGGHGLSRLAGARRRKPAGTRQKRSPTLRANAKLSKSGRSQGSNRNRRRGRA